LACLGTYKDSAPCPIFIETNNEWFYSLMHRIEMKILNHANDLPRTITPNYLLTNWIVKPNFTNGSFIQHIARRIHKLFREITSFLQLELHGLYKIISYYSIGKGYGKIWIFP